MTSGDQEASAPANRSGSFELGGNGRLPYRLKRCRHGWFAYNANDMYVGRSLDQYGEYSEVELIGILKLIRPGDVVVEAGANIGSLTVPLAQHVGETGFVHAFEPERLLHQLLGTNVALNVLLNVATMRAAAGAKNGAAVMPVIDHHQPTNFGAYQLQREGKGSPVEMRTIDSLDLKRCDLIKIDVEGMEREVLLGAAETIARFHPALHVENNAGPKAAPLITHIMSLGYRLWWHVTPLYWRANYFDNPEDVFGSAGSANMICVHETSRKGVKGLRPIESADDPPPLRPSS